MSSKPSRRPSLTGLATVMLAAAFTVAVWGGAAPAQAQSGSPLCPSEGESQQYEWADRLSIGGSELSTGRVGYHDGTATPLLTVQAGQTYPVQIDARTNGETFEQYFGIWLDLDQDLKIVDPGERVMTIANVPVTSFLTVHDQITVPPDAFNGIMYGRMIMEYAGNPALCGDYPYGTTIDFRLEVIGGQDNPNQQPLTIDIEGAGSVVSDPPGIDTTAGHTTARFNIGQEVTLTATPSAGLSFDAWSGAVSDSSNPVTVTIGEQPTSVTASFAKLAQSPLSVTPTGAVYGSDLQLAAVGGSGSGEVTFQVDDAGSAGCAVSAGSLTSTSVGSCTVSASKAGDSNYEPTTSPATTITIDPKLVTVTNLTAIDRDYDGTRMIDVAGDPTLTGQIANDEVAVTGTPAGTTSSSDVGSDRSVAVSGLTLTGLDAANYELDLPTLQVTIAPRVLDVTGARVYDGTPTFQGEDLSLEGTVDGESLVLHGVATASTITVGTDLGLDVDGLDVSDGSGAVSNYRLAGGNHRATITTRPLTLSGFRVDDRVYDATTTVVGKRFEDDRLEGDQLQVRGQARFASKAAGADRPVSISDLSLTGPDASNYHLATTSAKTTATILPATLTVDGVKTVTRPYDGTNVITLRDAELKGVRSSDVVTLRGRNTGEASSAQVGTHPLSTTMSLSGPDAGNYRLDQPTGVSATITRAHVTVSGARVAARTFDGTRDATILGAKATGIVDGERVSLINHTSGTFRTADAGKDRAVSTSVGLTGADAANYTIVQPELRGTILPATATLTLGSRTVKSADGNPAVIEVITEPAGVSGVKVDFLTSVLPPTAPGVYPFVVRVVDGNFVATPITGYYVIGATGSEPPASPPSMAPILTTAGASLQLAPGQTLGLVDGQQVEVVAVTQDNSVQIKVGTTTLTLTGVDSDGVALPAGLDAVLRITDGGSARVSGDGFLPGSVVELWLFSEPFYLGSVMVSDDGSFAASFELPAGIEIGEHTLQANGIGSDGTPLSSSLGIVVEAAIQTGPETASSVVPIGAPSQADALPTTGVTLGNLLFLSLAALGLGTTLLLARRPRRLAGREVG